MNKHRIITESFIHSVCVCAHTYVKHGDGDELINSEGSFSYLNTISDVEGNCILWGRSSFLARTLIILEFVSFCFNVIYSAAYINIGLCLGENTKFHLKSDLRRAGLLQQALLKVPRLFQISQRFEMIAPSNPVH